MLGEVFWLLKRVGGKSKGVRGGYRQSKGFIVKINSVPTQMSFLAFLK